MNLLPQNLGIQIHAFKAFLEKSQFQLQKSITAKSDERKACHECISKFGSLTQIPAAETALRSYNFHLCYTEIQSFYLRMGTNDAELFEKEAKSHRLQPGQDLNTHLTTVCKALERWNTIVFIEEEAMRTNYRDASNYVLEHPEVAIDNSGELTDAEVLATPHRQLVLHESKRLKIYVQSLADSPRFQHVIHTLYQLPETERTVRKFLNDCRIFESSMLGQMVLQTERSTCPNWKEKAQTHVNKVQSTFDLKQPSGPSANLATSRTTDSSDSKYCRFHPNSKTHTTEECQNKDSKKRARVSPNCSSSDPRPKSGNSDRKVPPCIFCESKEGLQAKAHTHSNEDCRIDPKSKAFVARARANAAALKPEVAKAATGSNQQKLLPAEKKAMKLARQEKEEEEELEDLDIIGEVIKKQKKN
jgi:hypothetical protein